MNLIRTYTRCAAALTALGITSFATAAYTASDAAPLLAVIGLPASLLGWWLSARAKFLLPRWLVNSLLTLALAYAILRSVAGFQVETIAELVVFIQIIKIGDRRSPRDDAQVLSLAVFLAIAAMLTSNAFWVGVQLIVFVPLLIGTVMLFQIYAGLAGTAEGAGPTGPRGGARRRRDALAGPLRGTIAFATVLAVAMAVFVFVIMPRGIGENSLGRWPIRGVGNTTGFTSEVRLGDRSVISESQKIVMEVRIRSGLVPENDPTGNLGNSENVYYLRGAVLDRYQNGAWTVDPADKDRPNASKDVPDPPDELPIGEGPHVAGTVEQQYLIYSMDRSAPIFTVWRPVKLLGIAHGTTNVIIQNWSKILTRRGVPGPVQYSVLSVLSEPPVETDERTEVSFPASERLRQLADRILTDSNLEPDPAKRPIAEDSRAARAIEAYLRTRYTYTLVEQPVREGVDPIEHFLFSTREGHCEYFASAMTALCRSVGVNARMVAGYVAAEFNSATGRYVIRESNAHAWVEAEAGKGNWRRYDPTPPADLIRIHRPSTGLLGRIRHAMESAEYAWNASVVSFDEGARQRLLGPEDEMRPGILARLDRITERIRYAGPWHLVRSVAIGLAVFLGVAALATIVQALMAFWARRGIGRGAGRWIGRGAAVSAPQFRLYRRMLDALARRGYPKPEWRPPLSHAGSIPDATVSDATAKVGGLYYRFRFGGRPPTESEIAEAGRAIGTIEGRKPV